MYIINVILYYYIRRQSQSCPIDYLPLSIDNLFPDNYTKREIDEQKVTCLNIGCVAVIPLLEADQHYATCEFNKNQVNFYTHCSLLKNSEHFFLCNTFIAVFIFFEI